MGLAIRYVLNGKKCRDSNRMCKLWRLRMQRTRIQRSTISFCFRWECKWDQEYRSCPWLLRDVWVGFVFVQYFSWISWLQSKMTFSRFFGQFQCSYHTRTLGIPWSWSCFGASRQYDKSSWWVWCWPMTYERTWHRHDSGVRYWWTKKGLNSFVGSFWV